MERLELAQLRAALRVMTPREVADLLCTLNQRCDAAARLMRRIVRTDEYAGRMLAQCRQKLGELYAHTDRSGVLVAARRCAEEFARAAMDERAALDILLFAVEGGLRWAGGTDAPSVFGNALVGMFTAFVERLNRQSDGAAFRELRERITQLELDAGLLGWTVGETLSECCLDIRWWGEACECD